LFFWYKRGNLFFMYSYVCCLCSSMNSLYSFLLCSSLLLYPLEKISTIFFLPCWNFILQNKIIVQTQTTFVVRTWIIHRSKQNQIHALKLLTEKTRTVENHILEIVFKNANWVFNLTTLLIELKESSKSSLKFQYKIQPPSI